MNENNKEKTKEEITSSPLLLLGDRPLFPENLTTMIVARATDEKVIEKALEGNGYFVALLSSEVDKKDKIGTLCKITKFIRLPNSAFHLFTSTLKRVKITSIKNEDGVNIATFKEYKDLKVSDELTSSYVQILKDLVSSLSREGEIFNFGSEVNVYNFDDALSISWYIASSLSDVDSAFLQSLLTERNSCRRLDSLITYLTTEKEIVEKKKEAEINLTKRIQDQNKEVLLREQIDALNDEIKKLHNTDGGEGSYKSPKDIKERAKEKRLPIEYREVVDRELEKIEGMRGIEGEYTTALSYIETILDLPFSFEEEKPSYSIKDVKLSLEKDHYGMKEVKSRIVEFLASRLKAENNKGAIICLTGAPGVGKTSVGFSIAKALGKKYTRFSVGGLRDEAEIKGHRRTYVGAMPGKIIQSMIKAGTTDPVILIDEIDKMGSSYQGDPASGLLEVLDPEQNSTFTDLYLNLPYDLSRVLFIVTANDLSSLPRPLLDRMEIIEMDGYTPREKVKIGKNYLVPELMKKNGLTKSEFKISDSALLDIAEEYSRESGVRGFKNEIDKIMRKVSLTLLENQDIEKPIVVEKSDLFTYLDIPTFPSDEEKVADKVGMAMGLAWTSAGGDVIPVEALSVPIKGDMKITGQLGDVMKESVSIALSVVKKEAYIRGLDISFFEKNSIHLHCPEGAVPKDGPSAGVTLFSALWSMYRGIKVKSHLAMTGELTLTGRVESIGGLKEKILGARRNGIKEIIVPKGNLRDLNKLDKEVKGNVIFHTAETIEDIISIAFPEENTSILSEKELQMVEEMYKNNEKKEKEEETLILASAFKKVGLNG